jgi:hypothetical protein
MKTTTTNKAYELSLDIANFLNEVNHNTFTKREILTEISTEYQYQIENDNKQLLETLQDELTNSYGCSLEHTMKCLELINQVKEF